MTVIPGGFRAPTQREIKVGAQDVHRWIQDMGWEVPGGRSKYPTKYEFDGGTREQFKLIVGEYCRMETEKDDRQYGSLLDSLARLQAGGRIEPRWAEAMKFVTTFLELGEYSSIGGSAMLLDAVVSPEQRNGYLAQVEDEVRHTNQLGYLKKYFASQYYDPAGFTGSRGHRHGNPLFWSNRQQACETFVSGDPVLISLNLQMVAEACFTNPLVVAMTEWAAANGDEVTPTVFLSIQSDELRHMANGYQTIVSVIENEHNMQYLQTDLENAFWIQHRGFSSMVGRTFEYGAVNRAEPWAQTWNDWVIEDWGGIWMGRFSKFGLEAPKNLADASRDAYWAHHDAFAVAYALWPFIGYRIELPNDTDKEWFERHYPGWYSSIGRIFDRWREIGVENPANRTSPIEHLIELGKVLHICRVCQSPLLGLTPQAPQSTESVRRRIIEYGGRKHALCSDWCERMYLQEPERYTGQNFLEIFDGWELSEIIRATGGVRSDGRTLVAQPHLRSDWLWTIDDLAATRIVVRDPHVAGVSFEKG
ncbi:MULTISPECIES: ferritin family protein [Mycolicibacterium]|uniref:methane monooxygenase n=1 Tax=Mycolicibacterium elephantis TaxID=81858 RepID=UPI0006293093|nr:methane monooxygenase [Mycolicibacterium elephantis]KKW62999.1 methane monooxygenase [Mycolicibacterium elephantis]OBB16514.1 methane monooxygenase [Mycolicibacterium elephantis]